MNKPLKLIRVGNSVGIILPKEMLRNLGVDEGDTLFPVGTPNGVELRPGDADFEEEMKILREVMRRRRSALRQLAK